MITGQTRPEQKAIIEYNKQVGKIMTWKIKYITLAVMQVLHLPAVGIPYYFAGNLIGITVIRAGG